MTEKRFHEVKGYIYDKRKCIGIIQDDYTCENIIDLLNSLVKKNEQLKKENQGIQDKVMRLLDYVEIKQCATRTEIKKWWNGDVE